AGWTSHTFNQLLDDVYNHTYAVMQSLKTNGVTPEWVQVGNEINPGMLLPDGSSSNFTNLAQIINKGYDAVKAVSISTKVVIHLANGHNNSFFTTFFDGLRDNGGKWDVIGMSYYPYWIGSDYTSTIKSLSDNLLSMAIRYNTEVIVAEIGGDYRAVQNTYDMLIAVMNKISIVPENRGLGLLYWEPEGAEIWSGYKLSAWGNDGKPTAALDAFLYTPPLLATMNTSSGTIVTIYSNHLSKYITANINDSYRLSATASTITGNSERFEMINNTNGTISFKSLANNLYVSASSTSSVLIADSSAIDTNQKFVIISGQDGYQAISSCAISTHWNTNTDNKIYSQWNDAYGSWQSFTLQSAINE
ncbi:MAG TPA: glycosyl hydrolase 53 family protein, partial [Spirochaetota bacterium]|nr:glycosyl hydrolase 53 family protein [Spirochaetota bacterium]